MNVCNLKSVNDVYITNQVPIKLFKLILNILLCDSDICFCLPSVEVLSVVTSLLKCI